MRAARCFKMMDSAKIKQLFEVFQKYGPVPRLLLRFLVPHTELDFMSAYDVKLSGKVADRLAKRSSPASETHFREDDPHAIIMVNPAPDESMGFKHISTIYSQSIATPYIGGLIAAASNDETKRGARLLYNWMFGQPQTRTSAGWVFEGRVHTILKAGGRFRLRRLSGHNNLARIDIKSGDTFTTLDNLASHLRSAPGSPQVSDAVVGVYQHPARANLASIDSMVVVNIRNKGLQPILFQITIAAQHPVKASGLEQIVAAFPARLTVEPVLVFVVPASQSPYAAQEMDPKDHKYSKWSQYCMSIDDNRLWGRL